MKFNKKTIQLMKASKLIKHLQEENSKMKELIENPKFKDRNNM